MEFYRYKIRENFHFKSSLLHPNVRNYNKEQDYDQNIPL